MTWLETRSCYFPESAEGTSETPEVSRTGLPADVRIRDPSHTDRNVQWVLTTSHRRSLCRYYYSSVLEKMTVAVVASDFPILYGT
jgi:hypothetical protein